MCPPYNDMDFDELVRSLEASKVVSDRSFLIFEYPKEVGQSLATTLGPLTRLVNRPTAGQPSRSTGPTCEEVWPS